VTASALLLSRRVDHRAVLILPRVAHPHQVWILEWSSESMPKDMLGVRSKECQSTLAVLTRRLGGFGRWYQLRGGPRCRMLTRHLRSLTGGEVLE
jgi:hypothetical protein